MATSKILICDDEEGIRESLKLILGDDHNLITVDSGEMALQALSHSKEIKVMLLDIKMPSTDGFDVLRWIRNQPRFAKLCVVMITSSDEIRDMNLAYKLGANSFLVKPLDFWNAAEPSRSLERLLARC